MATIWFGPARLEPGRHQEDVAAGVDPLLQRPVEGQETPTWSGWLAESDSSMSWYLHSPVPMTTNWQPSSLHQRIGDRADQVEALLVDQPRHEADQRHVGLHGQARLFLQRGLVRGTLFDAVHVELDGDMWIGGRIVQLGVDAVEDAEQPVAAVAQDRVQPLPELGRQDLTGVGLADGVDDVGKEQSARHHVHDVVQIGRHVRMGDEAEIGQPGNLQHPIAEDALVLEVVRRVDGRSAERRTGRRGRWS